MESGRFDHLVSREGVLDSGELASRETLYVGRNGKAVERFCLDRDGGRSFIFKPLTNPETVGRETWVYRNILPHIPVRYPALHAHAPHLDAGRYWAVYEDLGPLEHRFDRETLVRAAAAIPYWHQLPIESVPSGFSGHTPRVEQVSEEVWGQREALERVLTEASFPVSLIPEALRIAARPDEVADSEAVVLHGDYHPLNISLRKDELIVLDWEYVQINSVYWDLYNLLDMTSPNYRKPDMSGALRNEVLAAYYARRQQLGWSSEFDTFRNHYYRYALAYSLWILLLIDKDLQKGSFDTAALLEQRQETLAIAANLLLGENTNQA
ncbi:phosphotransferase family protein [Paenibacillus doosanensis]|uniref:phosphotransferase family protein n=1 Tax=Paenibacillus doosanensis TaxID=1229154 RepID=UPI00217F84D0|nr:aminoglycoside phosphotransferase family protein [Paenibacillus doosanensis]